MKYISIKKGKVLKVYSSSKELYEDLKSSGFDCYLIGGAKNAGELDAKRAIDQGTRLALSI